MPVILKVIDSDSSNTNTSNADSLSATPIGQ